MRQWVLLHQLFEQSVSQSPDKEALVFEGTRHTYADINRRASQLAAALQHRGVQRGDRVATFLDNSVEAVVSIYAALKCGAVFMPVNPLTKRDKLAYLLNDSRASALIAHAPDDDLSIVILTKDNVIEITADQDIEIKAKSGKLKLSGNGIEINSQAGIKLEAKQNLDLKAGPQLNIKGGIVNIN